MTDIVFVDTETTGLDVLIDDIWEFAGIRVTPDGAETTLHLQLCHDIRRADGLPDAFAADRADRFDGATARRQPEAAREIAAFFALDADFQKPHLAGINPAFDAAMIARLFRRNGIQTVPWHYHLLDVRAVAIGALHTLAIAGRSTTPIDPAESSDDLARRCGAEPPTDGRHTALGDAQWALDWWRALTPHRGLKVVR